jgi:electron-transferring-flavoprotein dehydrogenase
VKRIFDLERDCQPQVYGIGIKELWDIDPAKHEPGKVIHTQGWPLTTHGAAAGSTTRRTTSCRSASSSRSATRTRISRRSTRCSAGSITRDQRLLEGGKRVSYGARAINEGGWQSCPHLAFPGRRADRLLGGLRERAPDQGQPYRDEVGHAGRRGGARGARRGRAGDTLQDYETRCGQLDRGRAQEGEECEPAVAKFGATLGTVVAGADMWMRQLRVGLPFTFKHHPDHEQLLRKEHAHPINYPKPDGVISFDKLSSVFLSNTNHEEDQPIHLTLKDADIPTHVNLPIFDGPEQRYCPAGVYEYVETRAATRASASRSTPRTASTARPATSKTRVRTSTGWCRRGAGAPTTRICSAARIAAAWLRRRRASSVGLGASRASTAGRSFAAAGLSFVTSALWRGPASSYSGAWQRDPDSGPGVTNA